MLEGLPRNEGQKDIDEEIKSLAEKGDRDAVYLKLRENFLFDLKGAARMLTRGNETRSDDLVEETLEKAALKISEFDWESSLKTWMIKILRNASIDSYRKNKGHETISIEDFDEFKLEHSQGRREYDNKKLGGRPSERYTEIQIPDNKPNQEDALLKEERGAALKEAIQKIQNPEHRKVVELRLLEGLEFPEIAAELNKNEQTVKVVFHRALPVIERYLRTKFKIKKVGAE